MNEYISKTEKMEEALDILTQKNEDLFSLFNKSVRDTYARVMGLICWSLFECPGDGQISTEAHLYLASYRSYPPPSSLSNIEI